MGFVSGLFIGSVGVMIAAYFVYLNNKKKIKAAIAILEGPGATDEKIKKIRILFGI